MGQEGYIPIHENDCVQARWEEKWDWGVTQVKLQYHIISTRYETNNMLACVKL